MLRAVFQRFILALVFGLVGGAAFGLAGGVAVGQAGGLAIGLGYGAVGGLLQGVMASHDLLRRRLDEGLRTSSVSVGLHIGSFMLVLGLVGGVAGGIVNVFFGLATGLVIGLGYGLVYGANRGGWYLLMQWHVRREAELQVLFPNDIVGFLEAATKAGIFRRTGGGVQFRHRLFADRLAREAPTPGLMDLRLSVGNDEVL